MLKRFVKKVLPFEELVRLVNQGGRVVAKEYVYERSSAEAALMTEMVRRAFRKMEDAKEEWFFVADNAPESPEENEAFIDYETADAAFEALYDKYRRGMEEWFETFFQSEGYAEITRAKYPVMDF